MLWIVRGSVISFVGAGDLHAVALLGPFRCVTVHDPFPEKGGAVV